MVVKVYDAGEFFVEYEVRPGARTYSFTDHTGKEVTMTEQGFFDPWFIRDMGFQNKQDVALWWIANRHNVPASEATSTFLTHLTRWFDQEETIIYEWVDLANLTQNVSYIGNSLSFASENSRPVERFSLVPSVAEEEGEKPTYVINFLGLGGVTKIKRKDSVRSSTRSTNWNRRLNYSFKMDSEQFKFFRKLGKESDEVPMYGMELELNTKLSCEEIHHIITEVEPKQEPFFIFKDDSSISGRFDYRYELVTVPCSRKYLRDAWKKFFGKLEKLTADKDEELKDYFDTSSDLSNGIHIHISKNKFYGDFHRRKFLTAFNQWDSRNVEFMTKISGRPHEKFNQNSYCPIDREFEGRTLARRLKKHVQSSSRSVCHNSNSQTLEVRLYQGIVSLDHILRCLDHTDAVFEFTNQIGLKVFGRDFVPKFEEFILKGVKYKSLRNFITGEVS